MNNEFVRIPSAISFSKSPIVKFDLFRLELASLDEFLLFCLGDLGNCLLDLAGVVTPDTGGLDCLRRGLGLAMLSSFVFLVLVLVFFS